MQLKILTTCILVLFTQKILAQKSTAPWSEWMQHPCYKGLSISVKDMGYNADNKAYYWGVRIQNNYPKRVSFRYLLSVGGEKENVTKYYYQQAFNLSPDSIKVDGDDVFRANMFKSSSKEWLVMVGDLCFDGMRCGEPDDCYAECDVTPKVPNQPCGLIKNAINENKSASLIEGSIWLKDAAMKVNLFKIDGGILSLFMDSRKNGYLAYYNPVSPGRYRHYWSGKDSLYWDMEFKGANKIDEYAGPIHYSYKYVSGFTAERTNWVCDDNENLKRTIIKTKDGLMEFFKNYDYGNFYFKSGDKEYRKTDGEAYEFINENRLHSFYFIDGKKTEGRYFHIAGKKKQNTQSLSGKVKPEEGTCMIWEGEGSTQKFKIKIATDGIYTAAIDGDFGSTPAWPKVGGSYQATNGHSTWTLTFINDKRYMTTVNGQLSEYYNCVSDFYENADEWMNVKDKYTVKLLKTDGGVLSNISGKTIFYSATSSNTYQWSDRPCNPDCYKTVFRFTGEDSFSVEYTNLGGQVNQADNFVRGRK